MLYERTGAAAEASEVLTPVGAAPDLEPVHDQPEAGRRPHDRRREQREVREGARVHDVVAAAAPEEVAEHAEPEDQRREDSPPAGAVVETQARSHRDDLDVVRELRPLTAIP